MDQDVEKDECKLPTHLTENNIYSHLPPRVSDCRYFCSFPWLWRDTRTSPSRRPWRGWADTPPWCSWWWWSWSGCCPEGRRTCSSGSVCCCGWRWRWPSSGRWLGSQFQPCCWAAPPGRPRWWWTLQRPNPAREKSGEVTTLPPPPPPAGLACLTRAAVNQQQGERR